MGLEKAELIDDLKLMISASLGFAYHCCLGIILIIITAIIADGSLKKSAWTQADHHTDITE